MKITSFCPMIITPDAEGTIKAYESLGFNVAHIKENAGMAGDGTDSSILKNERGDRIIIASASVLPQAVTMVHINVDNYREAVEHFEKLGYKIMKQADSTENTTSVACAMVAPDGHMIQVSEHIK